MGTLEEWRGRGRGRNDVNIVLYLRFFKKPEMCHKVFMVYNHFSYQMKLKQKKKKEKKPSSPTQKRIWFCFLIIF